MSLQSITEAMRQKMGGDSGLGASLKFDCGADGIIVIDGSVVPNTISNEDRETDCTIGISMENLQAMLDGELNGVSAFMSGKIKVEGDMSVAMKLQSVV
jgi:putative sterol carrier protein